MNKIRLFPSGREVDCDDGQTVLAALENAGYALPNNCRAGACGECKIRVRNGQFDQGMVLDMALSQEERKQGYGLMCMAKPISELLEIEWGTEDAQPKLFPPREDMLFVVTDRIERTPSISEFRLRPVSDAMRYWPGQYVTLGDDFAGAPPRAYSIANAPRPDGEISLHIAQQDGGTTSQWAHRELQPGGYARLSGPYGTFIGDPSSDGPVLCLAAGSGLAPILALTEAALRRGYRSSVTLLFSARSEVDVYQRGLMKYWESRHRNFRFRYTCTREQGDDLNGRVPDILGEVAGDLSDTSVYIAGSPAFVDACAEAVKARGARDELLHTEGYYEQQLIEAPSSDRLFEGDFF
jgi:CDP-4-dehydro-6-deoxyglucose reductase